MGRPRKHNTHLPQNMRFKHGAYYFERCGKMVRLGKEYGPALIRYAELAGGAPVVVTVAQAVAHYLESSASRLAKATLEGYRSSSVNLARVFGAMPLADVTAAHVYRYLIERGDVQANRDKALLSAAYTHARNIGAFSGDDPAKGLHYRNPEVPRERYVTDAELDALIAAASPKLATIVRFIALTGMRQGDALRVRMADLDAEGIAIRQGKTGKRMVILWSDDLREVVETARVLWRRFGREWLFESQPRGRLHKRAVGPYTPSGLRALWRVARKRAGLPDVRLHDLRGKVGSDSATAAAAQQLLGHADGKVTAKHYRRRPERVKPIR